jgi:hypothetical protein
MYVDAVSDCWSEHAVVVNEVYMSAVFTLPDYCSQVALSKPSLSGTHGGMPMHEYTRVLASYGACLDFPCSTSAGFDDSIRVTVVLDRWVMAR